VNFKVPLLDEKPLSFGDSKRAANYGSDAVDLTRLCRNENASAVAEAFSFGKR
jgi:hypothetical protein